MLHSRWINGALAYWETHQSRIVDAIGAGVVKYINHFTDLPLDNATWYPNDWMTLGTNAGADIFSLPASMTGGILQVGTGAAAGDNDEAYMQLGGAACATNAPFVIAGALGVANNYPLYFGARVKALEHADEAYFVGLAEEGSAVTGFIAADATAMVNKDFIGFNTLSGTPTVWNITWKALGAVVNTTAVAVNASDWHIFEFWYDGQTTVSFWIDGVQSSTTATTTASTFPSAEEMAPIIAVKTGQGTLKRLHVDWLRVIQFFT